jgi:hypothetical protein
LAEGDRDATSDQLRFTRDYLEQFALFVADQHQDVATSRATGRGMVLARVRARSGQVERTDDGLHVDDHRHGRHEPHRGQCRHRA